ncbi:uncharacterized protein LOC112568902 isoform X3 [Pomacea canaliculata]|uniref:uncharacterized protein LOC112568902 isoform X3 n=1 Tax=Pomacea canaliculata TaxID=400727 RepID=UPI000D72BBCC|nr:uncharacterized protein LOC112568902 isoform X3 [Pomacea canaliculata]
MVAGGQPSIHRLKQILWLISLMEILGGKGGNSEDVTTNCPARPFVEGKVINITCDINQTSISNAGCFIPPTKLDFKVVVTAVPFILCSPDYPPPSCAQNLTEGACFCAHQNGDIYTYQYNFIANAGYQGGNITCDICALPTTSPTKKTSENCTNIFIETTTAATTTKTTGSTSSSQPEWWCILLIIIIILLIIIIIIIIIVVRRKHHHKWAMAIEDWNGCKEILEVKDFITILEYRGSLWKRETHSQIGWFPCEKVKLEACCASHTCGVDLWFPTPCQVSLFVDLLYSIKDGSQEIEKYMWIHLSSCLSARMMTPFPVLPCQRDTNGKELHGQMQEEVFCICLQPNYPQLPMISCDICEKWYHCRCMKLPDKAKLPKRFECTICRQT